MTSKIVTDISQRRLIAPTRPTRVCAYVRVSTAYEGQLNSLHNQIDPYNRKSSNSPQYKFIGIFSDTSVSGTKINRPDFDAMLEKAKSGEIDLIYTKSVSQFACNTLIEVAENGNLTVVFLA